MKRFDLNFNSIQFYLLLVTLVHVTTSSTRLVSNPILQDAACAIRDCGQGKCRASTTSMLGFDCECDPGWNKIQLGPLLFSPCVIPNCTASFQCDSGSPPPAPLLLPPLLNLSNPCALIWCGDGTCITNGTGHSCKCFEGSANLLNMTGSACFKQCYLEADCSASVGLGPTVTPPLAPSLDTSHSRRNGSVEMLNCSRILHATIAITLLALLLCS